MRVSGIDPLSVGYIECHATGTAVGDAVEVRSMATIFAGADGLPMGALKANLGHMITASGAAAIVKILGAFEAGTLPPTIDAEHPIEAIGETPMRILARAEPWDDPRARAAPRSTPSASAATTPTSSSRSRRRGTRGLRRSP